MKRRQLSVSVLVIVFCSSAALAQEIKVATWNIQNLRDQDSEGINPREPYDYARLRDYALDLAADVIALQELEGEDAAKRVFSSADYRFLFSRGRYPQRTGFSVKAEYSVLQNNDLELSTEPYKPNHATDITLVMNDVSIRLLSVHLTPGCWRGDIDSTLGDCATLRRELESLGQWIDQRKSDGTPFVVLGDFNRDFDWQDDAAWPLIDKGHPSNPSLHRVTEGRQPECWNGRRSSFRDHIILGPKTLDWLVPESFSEFLYRESPDSMRRISDHCPISVSFRLPDRGRGTTGVQEHGPPPTPGVQEYGPP